LISETNSGANIDEVKSLYSSGHILSRPVHCPLELYDIMKRCWSSDPQARYNVIPDTLMQILKIYNLL